MRTIIFLLALSVTSIAYADNHKELMEQQNFLLNSINLNLQQQELDRFLDKREKGTSPSVSLEHLISMREQVKKLKEELARHMEDAVVTRGLICNIIVNKSDRKQIDIAAIERIIFRDDKKGYNCDPFLAELKSLQKN
jgi:hypothetical protein